MKKLRPLYDRLYIERIESGAKTAGGLYIPEGSKEKGQTGKVVAIGMGKLDNQGKIIPLQVQVGDIVFFGKYAGTEIDENFVIIKEEEVLAIIES